MILCVQLVQLGLSYDCSGAEEVTNLFREVKPINTLNPVAVFNKAFKG